MSYVLKIGSEADLDKPNIIDLSTKKSFLLGTNSKGRGGGLKILKLNGPKFAKTALGLECKGDPSIHICLELLRRRNEF